MESGFWEVVSRDDFFVFVKKIFSVIFAHYFYTYF